MEGIVFLKFVDKDDHELTEEYAMLSDKSTDEIRKRAYELIEEFKRTHNSVEWGTLDMIESVVEKLIEEGYVRDIPLEQRLDDVQIFY